MLTALAGPTFCCTSSVGDERARVFCNLNFLAGKIVPAKELLKINKELNRIGFPNVSSKLIEPYNESSFRLWPILGFQSNVNGGNPVRNLQVGNLSFKSDPKFFKKKALTLGLGTSLHARQVFSSGIYSRLKLSYLAEYSTSSKDDIGQTGAEICASKQILGWNFLDFCTDTNRTRKTLSRNIIKNNWIQLSSYRTGRKNSTISRKIRLGKEDGLYLYDKIKLSHGRIFREGNGTLLEVGLKSSSTNRALYGFDSNFRSDFFIGEKQYAIHFSYANNHLGRLLGIKRKDQTVFGIFSMPFHKRSNLNVGYGILDSTINYFDDKYLILSISFH